MDLVFLSLEIVQSLIAYPLAVILLKLLDLLAGVVDFLVRVLKIVERLSIGHGLVRKKSQFRLVLASMVNTHQVVLGVGLCPWTNQGVLRDA